MASEQTDLNPKTQGVGENTRDSLGLTTNARAGQKESRMNNDTTTLNKDEYGNMIPKGLTLADIEEAGSLDIDEYGGLVIAGPNGDIDYMHIDQVEVFTGDDNGKETDCYSFQVKHKVEPELVIHRRVIPKVIKATSRLRSEPGVRITLRPERPEDALITIEVVHHKGRVYVRTVGLSMDRMIGEVMSTEPASNLLSP